MTADSIELLELFFAWKTWGCKDLTAREADAFQVLEQALRAEGLNGK